MWHRDRPLASHRHSSSNSFEPSIGWFGGRHHSIHLVESCHPSVTVARVVAAGVQDCQNLVVHVAAIVHGIGF